MTLGVGLMRSKAGHPHARARHRLRPALCLPLMHVWRVLYDFVPFERRWMIIQDWAQRLGHRKIRHLLLVAVLGCPAAQKPPPKPPPPPPPAIIPPAPLPPPPEPPPEPPRVKLLGLEVYPDTIGLHVGDTTRVCAYFRFSTGHVVLRPADIGICGADYLARFTIAERDLTLDEIAWVTCTGRYVLDDGCHREDSVRVKVS